MLSSTINVSWTEFSRVGGARRAEKRDRAVGAAPSERIARLSTTAGLGTGRVRCALWQFQISRAHIGGAIPPPLRAKHVRGVAQGCA